MCSNSGFLFLLLWIPETVVSRPAPTSAAIPRQFFSLQKNLTCYKNKLKGWE